MKKCAILGIILALWGELHGQGKVSSGYIVNLQGDTLWGEVKYSHTYTNPNEIRFVKAGDTTDQIYTPAQIRGFGSDMDIYESCVVDLNTGPADYAELNTDKEIHLVKDTVFLKVLLRGPKSLFLFTSRKGKYNFYIRSGAATELLIYQKYIRYLDNPPGEKVIMQNQKYVGQLLLLFSDMPDLRPRILKTACETNDLLNLFSLYYKRLKAHPDYEKKRVIFHDQAGLVGSFTSNKLFFYEENSSLPYADFPASNTASAGMFYDKSLGFLGHYSICNELVYNLIKTKATYFLKYGILTYVNSFSFQLQYLKLNTSVRRKIPLPKGNLLFVFGLSNGWLIAEQDEVRVSILNSHWGPMSYSGKAIEKVKYLEQSLFAGVGFQYHHLGLLYRFEMGNGFSSTSGLNITSQRQYLSFTYSFLK